MGTQFFIVFPEKQGTDVTSSYFEVDSIASAYLSQMSEALRLFKSIFAIEQYTLYYDKANYRNFRKSFVGNRENNVLLKRITEQAIEWNNTTCAIPEECQCASVWFTPLNPHNTISEAALRKRNRHPSVAVLQLEIPSLSKPTLPVEIGGKTVNLDIVPLNLLSMYQWISDHRNPRRLYLWNEKHGEYGKHVIANPGEDVSPLLSSREAAEALLPYAIGLKKISKLYIFDTEKDYYEEFMPGTGNYHSYHLLNDNAVPRSILINLKKLNAARQ